MFALSIFNFVSQLYILPDRFRTEIHQTSLKFMGGPYANGLSGHGGHSYYRARVDLGMKASPICAYTQSLTTRYLTTRNALLNAGARITQLKDNPEAIFIREELWSLSPLKRASDVESLVQSTIDVTKLPHIRKEMRKLIYTGLFNKIHPINDLYELFHFAYRSRWCKYNVCNYTSCYFCKQ